MYDVYVSMYIHIYVHIHIYLYFLKEQCQKRVQCLNLGLRVKPAIMVTGFGPLLSSAGN